MLEEVLRPVQRRLRMSAVLRAAVLGLLVGSALALVIAVVRLAWMTQLHWLWPLAAIAGSTLLGAAAGLLRRRSQHAAARLIDQCYGLKDRSISTLQFLHDPDRDPVRQLQIEEAQSHLRRVDPVRCVPMTVSRSQLRWAGGLAAAMLCVLIASNWMAEEVSARVVLPLAESQSNVLREEMLPELEKLAEEQQDPELQELVEKLEEKLQQMEAEAIDESDLLATLSEMEQALAEAREAMQLEQTDAMMKALASALKPSDEMQAAAAAMEAEDYEQAANKLEQVDPTKVSDKQRRAVADNLKKMLAKLQPGQQGQLSEAISQLSEGLETKNMSKCKKCLSKLAKACKKQGNCKKIGDCMSCQLNRLSQCKSQCRSITDSDKVAKTNSPSQSAGKGASGKPLGDQMTSLDSTRKQEELDSMQSEEGESETELLQAPEGEQKAIRQYAERYTQFRREAEAVLDSEPLPMGHRETVRTYFEAIRPQGAEGTEQ